MAEAIALSVAGWVASPIVSRLLNEGFSYVGDAGIKDKLENLETTILPQFHLVIEAVEKSNEHKTKLKLWLRNLKNAMYEAEDMLDLYKYRLIEEEKVHDLNSNSTPKVFGKFVGNLKRGLSSTISPQNKKLRESLIKLERIAAEAKIFRELTGLHTGNNTANDATNGRRPNVTTSLPPPHQVFGRDEERDEIIEKYLLDASEASQSEMDRVRRKGYSVVAIVGIGGAGKTTLAQLIYNDPRVVDYFGIKMWVCLSRKLDVFSLTREMVESASKKECPRLENLDALQKNLIDLIRSKKVLLVLDDVWCYKSEDETEWEQLLAPLSFGGMGSKILMTTRPENMPNMPVALRPHEINKLKDLGEDEFISLFRHHAFGGIKLSEPHKQEELEKIGIQILQKLSKSPLAAKAVGSQLSKRLEANFWRSALKQDNLGDTEKVLIWSYQRLDGPLQRCFSYFSLFPKGQRFQEEQIVRLWMAEGFIDSSDDSKRIEDIGSDYFDELVSGSFLQLVEETKDAKYYGMPDITNYGMHDTKYYGMHDLFHDLAEKVSKEDCLRIEGGNVESIPLTIRHLYVSSELMRKASMSFHKLRNLRTLIIFGPLNMSDSDLLSAAIEKFEKLRVLDLSWWSIKALPKSVRYLKHLRYLDLRWTNVVELPVSFDKLHHLQLLKLPPECITLPRSVTNMFNLRHLEARSETLDKLPYIGRLTSLQRLQCFTVDEKNGHDIGQLKNLNELRGSLQFKLLNNVGGNDKATEANLRYKKHLDTLGLGWRTYSDDPNYYNNLDMAVLDMEVLEGLQPPPNLTNLEICGCRSRRCPSWLLREGCLENLRSLSLFDTSFEDLPAISKLFPRCQGLAMEILRNLRMLPLLPHGLKALAIRSCPLLIFVSEEELQKSDDIKKSIMTIARSSQLSTAFKLTMGGTSGSRYEVKQGCLDVKKLLESENVDIPEDFQTFASEEMLQQLNMLQLWQAYCCCQEQRLEAIFRRREKNELIVPPSLQDLVIAYINITDRALSRCLGMLTSLTTLVLRGINTITTVPTDNLMSLCDLHIVNCYCLKSLGGLHALLSLKKLCIVSCPCLELEMEGESGGTSGGRVILPPAQQSPNAKRFVIRCLPNLVHLELSRLSSLASLSLSGLTALRKLVITDCPALSALDCSLDSLGTDDATKLTSVEELEISSCTTLSMLFSGGSNCLAGLSSLCYAYCPEPYFHEESFNCLTSLKTLLLCECKFQSLPRSLKSMSSLETLNLTYCPHISSLSDLPNSLRRLRVNGCHLISSLPVRLPESLQEIEIFNCPVLKERCQEPKGEDWPKIAHITYRSIV